MLGLPIPETVFGADQPNQQTSQDYFGIMVLNPVTDSVLPTAVFSTQPSNSIDLAGCRDQYISASFVISASQIDLTNFQATPGKLSGSVGHSIPASAVDIRTVKCWYQSAVPPSNIRQAGVRNLIPELLLHNDNLVRVDTTAKQNYLELPGGGELCISNDTQATPELIQPIDAATLQPLSISANTNKQFWVTVHVPANAAPGTYNGTIVLSANEAFTAYLPLQLQVYNFILEQPSLLYGIYYSGATSTRYLNQIGPVWKSTTQLIADLQGMFQNGIKYPSVNIDINYPTYYNTNDLGLRASLGFPQDILFWGNAGVPYLIPQSDADLNSYQSFLQNYAAVAKQYGYNNVATFGRDEASPSVMLLEGSALDVIHEVGIKTFITTSISNSPFEVAGLSSRVDYVNYSYAPSILEANKWHSVGAKVLSYANPQTTSEVPLSYRRDYGWLLFKNNYDGAFLYIYQDCHASPYYSGLIWNDFCVPVGSYRGHCLTYPTMNGVVDTVQYEGLREAINDMRYLATLQKAINDQPGATATAAQAWISQVDPNSDLDAVRAQMASWINQILGN